MDRASNGFKRNVLKAELWATHGQTRMRALASLFDPVMQPYAGDGILIAGIELESTDGGGKVGEFRQAWLCSTTVGTEEDWERSRHQPLEKNKGKE